MRFYWTLLASHVAVALVAAIAALLAHLAGGALWLLASAFAGGFTAAIASGFIMFRIRQALRAMETAVASGDGSARVARGMREFEEAIQRLGEYAQRWAEAATTGRRQIREVESLLTQLERRNPDRTQQPHGGAAVQIRQVLSGILRSLNGELDQVQGGLKELDRCTQEISLHAEEQNDAVNKTASYVEQLSANIDAVSDHAGSAQESVVAVCASADDASLLVRQIAGGVERLRQHLETSETKLRALVDHAQEIGAIVNSIGSISARTDLLALNASIESVRAGEQGRGFAVVAEEVRKLSEQTAQAAREATSLIESAQLEAQQSLQVVTQQRGEVDTEMQRVQVAGDALEQICQVAADSASRVGNISQAARQQLQLTRDIVLAIEQIANAAKATRSRSERAHWTARSLGKSVVQFDEALLPLRRGQAANAELATEVAKDLPDEAIASAERLEAAVDEMMRTA